MTSGSSSAAASPRVAGSISWLAIAQGLRSGTGLIATAILARILTPLDFGTIAIVLVVSGFVSMFAETGITSALIQRREVDEDHLSTAFWFNIAAATLLAVLGVALAPLAAKTYRDPGTASMLAAVMATLPLNALGQVSESLLQRRLAFRSIAVVEWLATIASATAAIGLALAGMGVWALVGQIVVASLVGAVGKFVAAGWAPAARFSMAAIRDLRRFSASVFGGSLVNYSFRKVDNFLIARYVGTLALGFYSLAYNLMLFPLTTCSAVILRVMFPVLAGLQTDLPRFRSTYLRTVRLLSTLTMPLVIGLGAGAPLLIRAAYGPRWTEAAILLRILTVVGVFEAINTAGIVFYAIGRPGVLLRWAIVSLVTMSISFFYAVRWGSIGVAWTYAAISPILFVMPHVLANRLISLPNRRFLSAAGPPFISAAVMGVIVFLALPYATRIPMLWLSVASIIAFGAVSYVASMLAFAVMRGADAGGVKKWLTGDHFVNGQAA